MPVTKKTPLNIGSARSPINLGYGTSAFRLNGSWHYRNSETIRRFGRRFVEATDAELMVELESRGYKVLCPAHECVDRPNLPCPACGMDVLRTLALSPKVVAFKRR
jgi:hypothetical protein